MNVYSLDAKFKQYAVPLKRILIERYGHEPDVRDAGGVVELHFPTIRRFDQYLRIQHFLDGFVAALEYNT